MKRTFYIAGVQFKSRNEINTAAKELKQGDTLNLVPEPTNKFDPNAVKIIANQQLIRHDLGDAEDAFLGYVPKKYSSEVAGMISIGAPVECIVDAVDPLAKTYEMFKVTVQFPVNEEEAEEDTDLDSAPSGPDNNWDH